MVREIGDLQLESRLEKKYVSPDMMSAYGQALDETKSENASVVDGWRGHSIGFIEDAAVAQERIVRSANAGLERDLGLQLGDLGLEETAAVRELELQPPRVEVPRGEEFAEAGEAGGVVVHVADDGVGWAGGGIAALPDLVHAVDDVVFERGHVVSVRQDV